MKHRDNKNNTTIYPVILLVISFLLIGLIFPGCATSVLRKKGLAYYKVGEFDEAVRCLEQEHARRPKDVEVKTLLFRAKLKSYQYHLDLARKYREAKRNLKDENWDAAALMARSSLQVSLREQKAVCNNLNSHERRRTFQKHPAQEELPMCGT